jgi:hypothetical protein
MKHELIKFEIKTTTYITENIEASYDTLEIDLCSGKRSALGCPAWFMPINIPIWAIKEVNLGCDITHRGQAAVVLHQKEKLTYERTVGYQQGKPVIQKFETERWPEKTIIIGMPLSDVVRLKELVEKHPDYSYEE